MDLKRKDPSGDSSCSVNKIGDNKHTMNYTTSFICKYDSSKTKERPTCRVNNALPPCMNFVSKRDPKKTTKVKDSKNDKKDKKKN